MGKGNFPLYAMNRGEVSRLALGRVDVDRLRLSAEEQVNFLPMVLGPMTMRPGLKHQASTRDSLKPRFLEFVFGNSDTAGLELTAGVPSGFTSPWVGGLRVWVQSDNAGAETGDLEPISRPGVATTVTNGTFSSAAGWTLSAQINSQDTASIASGKLTLNARAKGGFGSCYRSVHIPANSRNKEHGLRIVVERGPVTFKAGTSVSDGIATDDIIETTKLDEGVHSLAFTPTSTQTTVYVYFETRDMADRVVDSCTVESAGDLILPTPWGADDLDYVRSAQSGDIVFVACNGVHPYQVERRETRSWSVVKFLPRNGPVRATATVDELKLTPGETFGNTTLRSDRPFFTDNHVGCIFRLFQSGQVKKTVLAAGDKYTDPIRITGITAQRNFAFAVSGTFKGTIVLQRSTDDGDLGVGFKDTRTTVSGPFPAGTTEVVKLIADAQDNDDAYNNVICFYRVGFKSDGYTSGAAQVEFRDGDGRGSLDSGSGSGICRVTSVTNSKRADIEILKPLNSLNATTDWQESEWSAESGIYPSSVAFHDGRLWWAGGDKIWGSVSDDYTNFDIEKEGDAGPIQRSVGFGPIDTINWMLPLTRLILGREGAESSIRSSSLDEPITPTSFSLKDCSTRGSARIGALKCDTRGLFVGKSKRKLYELLYDVQGNDYRAHDLTRLHPDIAGTDGFTRLAIQFTPDTTVHAIRADGQSAVLLYDKEDEVEAWWRIRTDGVIEDVFVLPGTPEDHVYYVVKRVIDGSTVRYLERFARRDQCGGLPEARLCDSFIVDTGGDRTISGLTHLVGETVVAWGWNDDGETGVDLGAYTVNSVGKIVVSAAYDNVCVGLPYAASFRSAKLAYAGDQGTAVSQKKRVHHLGLVLYDTHYQGLKHGQVALQDAVVTVNVNADTVTDTAHGLQAGTIVSFDTDGSLLTGLSPGVSYYVAHPVTANSYKLATTHAAAIDAGSADRINFTGTQSGTHTRSAWVLDDLPLVKDGADVDSNTVFSEFDEPMVEVTGEWDPDARLYLRAQSPRPCTVAGAVIGLDTHG